MTRLHARSARSRLLLVCVTVALLGSSAAGAGRAAADPTSLAPPPVGWERDPSVVVRYGLPTDGPVRRPFESPITAYGPGHRGVDLDVAAGTPVRAAAGGTVAFAGPVAGTTWISIAHPDGIVTSYGPIAGTRVGRGDQVVGGQIIGVLAAGGHGDGAEGLHWGARRDMSYLDPLSLLEAGTARPSLIGTGGWRPTGHAATPYEPWRGGRWWGLGYHGSPRADAPGYAVAPNPNHLVTVAGLGSSSSDVPIDPEHLGYHLRDVTAFSYAGRTAEVGAADDPRRDQLPYGPSHTWDGVDAAALRLRDQLRAQYAREPGRAVDLVGHSMGGVVILHYLAHYHDAYDRTLPPIGHVVTVASPIQGADVAALGTDVREHRVYGPVLDHLHGRLVRSDGPLGRHVGGMPLDVRAVDDLRVGSPLMDELAAGMERALLDGPAGPLAMGTRVLTIAGGTDGLVGAGRRTSLPAADPAERLAGPDDPEIVHRVLPGGHARVRDTEAIREVVWRFLADDEVVDSPGRVSTRASNGAGHLATYAGWRLEASDQILAPFVPARDLP